VTVDMLTYKPRSDETAGRASTAYEFQVIVVDYL
jgi:hypothetical protein